MAHCLLSTVHRLRPALRAQVINVPCTDPVSCLYEIKANDTLSKIADTAGSDVAALKSLNPTVTENSLLVGQVWKAQWCKPGSGFTAELQLAV